MMLYAVQTTSLETIEQKFLEPGHTEMEVDSMHAAIDNVWKNLKVNVPSEWAMVLQLARRHPAPYVVQEIEQQDIFDLHRLSQLVGTNNAKHDIDGNAVKWMKIKCIRVQKQCSDCIEVKENYDEQYRRVVLRRGSARKTRMRWEQQKVIFDADILKQAYSDVLPVSAAKKADLLKLCQSGVIPSKHHHFYSSLNNLKQS